MTTTHRATAPHLALDGPLRWRAIDIVTLAVCGVAFGVAFWGWDVLLYEPVKLALSAFPPAGELTLGVWLLPAVFGALLVRRPGAALLIEMIAANVEMLLGNQWGALVLVSALLQGLGVEVAVALFRWRVWTPLVAVLGGLLAATFEIVGYEWWMYVAEYSWGWKLAYLGFGLVSGAIIAGLGAWALVKAIAATGALDAFPPGRERLAAQATAAR